MMTQKSLDQCITILVAIAGAYSLALLIWALSQGQHLGAWIWDRHQNQFSWYSRPLFILPAAYYAYRRKIGFVLAFMGLMASSLFWFAAPDNVPASIAAYLEWENQFFFQSDSLFPLLALIAVVAIFLIALFSALWLRNIAIGLLVINIGTLAKILFSLLMGEEAGAASIWPSISSLIVINTIALLIWRFYVSRSERA